MLPTTGNLIKTSFLKIGVFDSKSDRVAPVPIPQKSRAGFHAFKLLAVRPNGRLEAGVKRTWRVRAIVENRGVGIKT